MIRILQGDCREVLATLPDASVHCVVTSPPYFGLRTYLPDGHADKHHEIGMEPTPDAYIATMVEVFREVRRVLRSDGTCWVNMGSSFASKRVESDRHIIRRDLSDATRSKIAQAMSAVWAGYASPEQALQSMLFRSESGARELCDSPVREVRNSIHDPQVPHRAGDGSILLSPLCEVRESDPQENNSDHAVCGLRQAGESDTSGYAEEENYDPLLFNGLLVSAQSAGEPLSVGRRPASETEPGRPPVATSGHQTRPQSLSDMSGKSEAGGTSHSAVPQPSEGPLAADQWDNGLPTVPPQAGPQRNGMGRVADGTGKDPAQFLERIAFARAATPRGFERWCEPESVIKPKDDMAMPEMLAIALRDDGWLLRSRIIWNKPNPMPESVTDRPTSSHEHVFLLTKSARYFFDADAVREPHVRLWDEGNGGNLKVGGVRAVGDGDGDGEAHAHGGGYPLPNPAGRNLRNVWTIATAPLSSAFSGGSYRIASRDCGVHDRQADLLRVLECDAQLDVFEFGRSPGKRSRPAELPEGAVVSIPLDRSELPSGVSSAIARNNLTRRTPELSERDVIFGDISGGHIECRGFLDHLFAMFARTLASNTSPDASPDGRLNYQSAQRPDRIVGIATYDPRPDGCSCYYAGTVNKRQDHFASFPPELAERCIKAGTSERGCCAVCGAQWVRVVERGAPDLAHQRASGGDASGAYHGQSTKDHASHGVQDASAVKARILAGMVEKTTTGWAPSCTCPPSDPIPCTVLDPFSGAFTSAMVADRLQRHAIGIELSEAYCEMARARLTKDAGMFADIAAD